MANPESLRLGYFFILVLFSVSFNPSLSCLEDHKQALLQFKSILIGELSNKSSVPNQDANSPFSSLDSWNSTLDCCHWDRVTCRAGTTVFRPVVGLHLSSVVPWNASISATSAVIVPLFHIKTLLRLDISRNSLQGEIPHAGFTNWTRLIHLDMSSNNFVGAIPAQMFYLTNLQYLDLKGNRFTDAIPVSILMLKKLRMLDISFNQLGGNILVGIGSLSNVSTLSLNSNKLGGEIPASIREMRRLEELRLGDNSLSGEIPTWLFEIEGLKILDIGGNTLSWNNKVSLTPKSLLSQLSLRSCGLVGELPKWLSNQKKLDFLDLSENKLEGPVPQWLTRLKIKSIFLADNQLRGALPPSLFNSQSLSWLDLSRNKFSGELPGNIGNASSIEFLLLGGNNFSGPLPLSLSKLPLFKLNLSENSFSGDRFPISPDATYVYISHNWFHGEVPTSFGKKLTVLDLSHNRFTGHFPEAIANWSRLLKLNIGNNEISGIFPESIGQLEFLQVLILRDNSLCGSIPNTIYNLSHLQILDLSGNKLVGNISKIGDLTGMIQQASRLYGSGTSPIMINWKGTMRPLQMIYIYNNSFLDLSNNQFSGTIPPTLGGLKGLKMLNLSFNNLSGEIPQSFGGLENIESLALSHNKLWGEIPRSFVKMGQLSILDLRNNKLIGKIPTGGQMDSMDPVYFANNSGLCGVQINVSCNEFLTPRESENIDDLPWFSWGAAGIGYAIGLPSAMMVIGFCGFINPTAKRPQRKHPCHLRS